MSVTKSLNHDQPTEHRDRLFIGEIRRDWEPKRVESFLRAILPDATTIDAYAEGSPLVRNRGFAFVSFADVGAAVRAKEKLLNSPIKMGGRVLTVDWARAEHTVSAEIMKTIANLFIRNIAPGTSELALKQLFGGEEAGVARVKIQRTYGFVRFHKRAQAEAAMEKHNGAVLNGSRLEVSWARPPPPGRTMKKTPPIGKHRLFTMNPQIMQQPVATHGFEGLPLLQVEAPLFTSPVLDVPLLTPAQTPVSTTPAASSMPLVFVPPPHQLPVPVGPFPEQSHLIKSFSERVRNHGLGDVRVITSAVVVNNLIFYVTTILVGYVRLDGPLAPSKSEAEQNAIVFASNYLNIPIC
uniref:RNA recognition motif domain containing protein n=1 Tax=Haemonchus contortus TaxID=6289 RepID=A0A7I4YJN3_HAECO